MAGMPVTMRMTCYVRYSYDDFSIRRLLYRERERCVCCVLVCIRICQPRALNLVSSPYAVNFVNAKLVSFQNIFFLISCFIRC